MNETYKKRLVQLAKEVMEMNKPKMMVVPEGTDISGLEKIFKHKYEEKLQFLLGYILALDDEATPIANPYKKHASPGGGNIIPKGK